MHLDAERAHLAKRLFELTPDEARQFMEWSRSKSQNVQELAQAVLLYAEEANSTTTEKKSAANPDQEQTAQSL